MSSKLFALDIGTRSVVGIILEEENNHFHVADILMKEHKERAMVDGQIHNVLYVAELIKSIKNELEQTHGPLTKVSVAAAGRALKTEQASVTINIKNRPIFTEEDINRLELQAVQQAQAQLVQQSEGNEIQHYYCVGYSVLYYKLDGEEIGSLVDQRGNDATVEVIATFLPRVVVESLIAALKRADLEMEAMTLEPIAAINVLIPPSMRRLNVALVDIGAGTSDIAITNDGTIVAYGMVPVAGDEITESLSDHYLLDFPVAEYTKRQLNTESTIIIKDILGFDQEILQDEVLQAIHPSIQHLTQSIGNEILRLNNQRPPKAVMLVGGGSLTPNITKELCKVLHLPENRVAVRGLDAIQNLTKAKAISDSPELVTPIGIAIAAKKAPIQYMTVTVNEQIVRLFEMKDMTVTDAFLAANIQAKQLYGKPGIGMSVTVNGQVIFIPGEHGSLATIFVNDEIATAKTIIKHGDQIILEEGQNGKDASAKVRDIIDDALVKKIIIQGQPFTVQPKVLLNGIQTNLDVVLKDRDELLIETVDTIEDLLHLYNKELINQLNSFVVYVDGKPLYLTEYTSMLYINGKPGKLNYPFYDGDEVYIEKSALPTAQNIADHLNVRLEEKILVKFQNEELQLKRTNHEVYVNGTLNQSTSVIFNGATIQFKQKESTQKWIFQDVFRNANWQLPPHFKGQFTILRNGTPATFETEIFGGDILEIILTD
ncbi:pilus assembly protein PilM [Ureibacillus manganicus]|uniref:Cell division protein n=1 Tax=Ureibacillus manganicus DSM 26584 TaxID=1384049 RepID=A0A0A3HTH5_9BACL|nr:pilus assembly protein PilM [Ureibacillus manganicus]KGR73593.1 cell division protein [Ureibacillus manganicus DSM 26584]